MSKTYRKNKRTGAISHDGVRHIRRVHKERGSLISDDELAGMYSVSKRTIRAVMKREIYKDVADDL